MVYEMMIREVAPERRADFIEAYKKKWSEVERPGCRGVRFLSCIEKPERVIVEISWDSVEAHENARNNVPGHGTIREVGEAFQVTGEGPTHYTIDEL
ncbi:MAG: Antibiotic biosynthesis monooxygenase [Chloroflexota bacterium]|jgi:heme-degrading monooxygenase HmoA|nr:Antibiotic biosynthesis monooxygenase [Chloroflexota bacterium]